MEDKGIKKITEDDLSYVVGGLDTAYVKDFIKERFANKYSKVSNKFDKVKNFITGNSDN